MLIRKSQSNWKWVKYLNKLITDGKMLKIISDQKIKIKSMINYNSYILDWLKLRSLKFQLLVRMW